MEEVRLLKSKEAGLTDKIEAFEDGITQAKLETAKSMKSENVSVSMIAHFTGLSVEEIEKEPADCNISCVIHHRSPHFRELCYKAREEEISDVAETYYRLSHVDCDGV